MSHAYIRRGAAAVAVASTLLIALSLAGCSSTNPVDSTSDEVEASGCILSVGGTEVVRYENGTVTGSLDLVAGADPRTVDVQFIFDDGSISVPTDSAHTLKVTVADQTVAESTVADPHVWSFGIDGVAVGETTLIVTILHEDHDDFVSRPIPVKVTS